MDITILSSRSTEIDEQLNELNDRLLELLPDAIYDEVSSIMKRTVELNLEKSRLTNS